jgi:rhodanese-related sulfurtransferase
MSLAASPVLGHAELTRLRTERPEVRLLDVRTPGEFEAEHIAGAYNVPLDTLDEHGAEIRARVADPVVLVCRSGQRARKAEEALRSAGMTNLYLLDGGMAAWTAAGLPVRRGVPRMSLERQVRIAAGGLAASGAFLALFVNPLFAIVPAFIGSGLVFAGVTDTCMMGMLLARLPYNRPASCDVSAMVRALTTGAAPVLGRTASASGAAGASCGA